MSEAEQKCPKCGSTRIDHPRQYGSGMRLVGCYVYCVSCKHEELFATIPEAFKAWTHRGGAK